MLTVLILWAGLQKQENQDAMKDSAEALKETVPYYLKHVAEQDQTEAEMPIGRVAT